jgi:5-methylcytosine-specific restriction endonuclease McrA
MALRPVPRRLKTPRQGDAEKEVRTMKKTAKTNRVERRKNKRADRGEGYRYVRSRRSKAGVVTDLFEIQSGRVKRVRSVKGSRDEQQAEIDAFFRNNPDAGVLTSAKRCKNPGQGDLFYFHGAFTKKPDAIKKEVATPGSFIKTVWYRSGPRYAVLTPVAKNPKLKAPIVRWKKPITKISDRQKQVRAHHPAFKPKGPKKCAKCGSGKNVVLDHKDGDESNLKRSNLRWLCTSCNTKEGIRKKRLGKGVRVRKYTSQLRPKLGTKVQLLKSKVNPRRKKNSLALKAVGHAASAIGLVSHKKAAKRARRNPDAKEQSAKAYQMFHGRAVDRFDEIIEARGLPPAVVEQLRALVPPEDYAKLGDLVSFLTAEGRIIFKEGERPILACNPEATRLYVIGGNQNMEPMLRDLKASKDRGLADLGEAVEVEYFTRKKFDDFKPIIYYHQFGEESGKRPRLMYDQKRRQIHLVGGNYKIKNVGIVD